MPQTRQPQNSEKSRTSKPAAKQTAPQATGPAPLAPLSLQLALADPLSASPEQVLQLQRQYGNRAVQRLIQRAEAEKIQRDSAVGLEGGAVDGDLQNQIQSVRGGGQPLDKTVGSKIGGALGADFSGVRVHTDSKSDTFNRSLSAKAFTLGSDVFFSKGAYNPGTHSGQHLLAHELTHVVQQGAASGMGQRKVNKVQTKLTVGPTGDKYEKEADRMASNISRDGEPTGQATGAASTLWIQRFAYIDSPVPDFSPANLTEFEKTASGQEGAYKAKKGNEKVWLKFTAKNDAMAAEYGNMVIAGGTSLKTPGTRGFVRGSDEFNTISGNVLAWANDPDQAGSRLTRDAAADVQKEVASVMENLQGDSGESIAQNPEMHGRLVTALFSDSIIKDMAEMMVVDALLGNSDRLDRNPRHAFSNIGNFFVSPDFSHLATLDNAAERVGAISGGNQAQSLSSKIAMLRDVANPANVRRAVDSLCDAFGAIAQPLDGGALAMSLGGQFRNMMTAKLTTAVMTARKTLLVQLKSNKATMKTEHTRLTQTYQNPELMPNWDTLRVKSKYLQLRNKGKADEDAIQGAIKHLGHKANKAAGQKFYQKIPVIGKRF